MEDKHVFTFHEEVSKTYIFLFPKVISTKEWLRNICTISK